MPAGDGFWDAVVKGDVPGHEFHGNQYTDAPSEYRGQHTAPGPDFGAPMHDLAGEQYEIFPPDIYDQRTQLRYYGTGDRVPDRESLASVNAVHGNPDAKVTMYRAVPRDVSAINPGDFVTTSRTYAQGHLDGPLNGDGHIVSKVVRAGDLWTNGDSINEWGWHPRVTKGESAGHPFRGNQYTSGESGGGTSSSDMLEARPRPADWPAPGQPHSVWPPNYSSGLYPTISHPDHPEAAYIAQLANDAKALGLKTVAYPQTDATGKFIDPTHYEAINTVLEGLHADYPDAFARLHGILVGSMRDRAAARYDSGMAPTITVNNKIIGQSPYNVAQIEKLNIDGGFHAKGSVTGVPWESFVTHEFGHHLDFEARGQFRHDAALAIEKASGGVVNTAYIRSFGGVGERQGLMPTERAYITDKVSRYAASSPREFMAELFAQYRLGSGRAKMARAYGKLIDAQWRVKKAVGGFWSRITKTKGDATPLNNWYDAGADGAISWGTPGDYDACVGVASDHMSDADAHGYAQLRHIDVIGYPAGPREAQDYAARGSALYDMYDAGLIPDTGALADPEMRAYVEDLSTRAAEGQEIDLRDLKDLRELMGSGGEGADELLSDFLVEPELGLARTPADARAVGAYLATIDPSGVNEEYVDEVLDWARELTPQMRQAFVEAYGEPIDLGQEQIGKSWWSEVVKFDESQHPRTPSGSPTGGQFASSDSELGTQSSFTNLNVKGQQVAYDKLVAFGATPTSLDSEISSRIAPDGKLDPALLSAAQRWYPEAHDFAQHFVDAPGAKVTIEQASAVIAALSPQNPWRDATQFGDRGNMVDAQRTIDYFREHVGENLTADQLAAGVRALYFTGEGGNNADHRLGPGMMSEREIGNAMSVLLDGSHSNIEAELGTKKTASFYNNIMFPGKTSDVTVDTHMLKSLSWAAADNGNVRGKGDATKLMSKNSVTRGTKNIGSVGYMAVADSVRRVAERFHLPADVVQAAYWIRVQNETPENW